MLVDITRFFPDTGLEVTHISANIFQHGVGQQFYFGMSTDIHHFGAENSDAAFNIRVDFIKLRHNTADGWLLFDQVDLVPLLEGPGVDIDVGGLDPSLEFRESQIVRLQPVTVDLDPDLPVTAAEDPDLGDTFHPLEAGCDLPGISPAGIQEVCFRTARK